MKRLILGLMTAFALQATAGDLRIFLAPEVPSVLDVALTSCLNDQIGVEPIYSIFAPTFQFRKFGFQWSRSDETFELMSLQIKFRDPDLEGGQHSCFLTGDDLRAVMGGQTVASPGDVSTHFAVCPIRCGSFQVKPTAPLSKVYHGSLEVFGVRYQTIDQMERIQVELPVSVQGQAL